MTCFIVREIRCTRVPLQLEYQELISLDFIKLPATCEQVAR